MSGTHVRVRLVAKGMVASDLLADRPFARMACIEVGRRETHLGVVVDHFALTEGLDERDIGRLVHAWRMSYGLPAVTAGTPYALMLPLPLSRVPVPGVAHLHEMHIPGGVPAGHVLKGSTCDLWVECADPRAADKMARSMRGLLPRGLEASVAVGDPPVADLECWAALRLAADVAAVG